MKVNTHDFPSHAKGKAIPYGVYDLAANLGWVSVGISFDTAQFAAAAIRGWWQQLGKASYENAEIPHDHRRLRRQQQLTRAPVEDRPAG